MANQLPFNQALCDEDVVNAYYFSAYSDCKYGTEDGTLAWNQDSRVQTITNWTLEQLVQNCSSSCPSSFVTGLLDFTRIPTGTLLFGSIGMLLYSKRKRQLRLQVMASKSSAELHSSENEYSRKKRKHAMHRVHRKIVYITNLLVMIVTGCSEFVPNSRGSVLPQYVPRLGKFGLPTQCIYGIPSTQQRIQDYKEYYWPSAFVISFHVATTIVSLVFVAHFVYWRSKIVKRILHENREVSNSMSRWDIPQPWILAIVLLSVMVYVSYPLFQFNEPKQGSTCLPYLIQNSYTIPFSFVMSYSIFNLRSNFSLLVRLKIKKVGQATIVTQTTLKRFIKDLVFFVGTLPAMVVIIRRSSATQLSWDLPYFMSRLSFFAVWFAHATIAKNRVHMTTASTASIQNRTSERFVISRVNVSKVQSESSVGGLSLLPKSSKVEGTENERNNKVLCHAY